MRLSKEEQNVIMNMKPLVNVFLKDRKRMGTDSPYTWYLLDENEIKFSIDLLGRCAHTNHRVQSPKLTFVHFSHATGQELTKEDFYTRPVDWLIKKQLVLPSSCSKCATMHKDYEEKRFGEFSWKCGKDKECPTKPIQLIPCFEYCASIIKQIPNVILNWALYGNAGTLLATGQDGSPLDSNCVRLAIESIRQVCQLTNRAFECKLGVNAKKVDLFTCSCANYLTIFAFEPDTRNFRFQIIDDSNVELLIAYLVDWFDPDVHLIVYEAGLDFLKRYAQYFGTVEGPLKLDPKGNQFFTTAFDLIVPNVQHGCKNQILFTKFLDEVIWRHQFGQTPYSTFLHIVSILRNQPHQYERPPMELRVEADSRCVNLDEMYYGRYDLLSESNSNPSAELRNNVRCHKCFILFNFQSIFNHLVSHLNLILRKRTQSSTYCDHCFKGHMFYDHQMHRELLEGRYKAEGLKTSRNACKICCIQFKSQKDVLKHLQELHRFQDFPYSCALCPFRTSFYHEKISHYRRNHAEVVKTYCKYCLKLYTDDKASEELFKHIQKHMEVKDTYHCTHCSLTFADEREQKRHFLHDHILQKSKSEAFNFQVIKYKADKLGEEGTALKVKLPGKAPIRIRQRKLSDGKQVSVEERRITKKNSFKLRYQRLEHDEISDKHYIMIGDQPVICLECCQPMDTNHLSKRKKECLDCHYKGYCPKALTYPCGLHFSGLAKHGK